MSLFAEVGLAPADPILGLSDQFKADPRSEKVNLGVGVYLDESSRLPALACVRSAEAQLVDQPRPYLPIDGMKDFIQGVRPLIFGTDGIAAHGERIVTVQALAGTGALKLGADLLKKFDLSTGVLVSDPSWENHRALFGHAGFKVGSYRYYAAEEKGIDFAGLIADLKAADPGTIVVLHACCHNPTGYDLSDEQWDQTISVIAERGLIPFLDMAYQGFGHGLETDRRAVARFLDSGMSFLVAHSFSKILSLYGERIGSLSVVTSSADESAKVLSQLKVLVRAIYSSPPTRGAAIAAKVLTDERLRPQWETELDAMRARLTQMRTQLVSGLRQSGMTDLDFIARQHGMFSYSGLSVAEMRRLREEYAIFGLDSGRICLAGLNPNNIDRVVAAIAAVRS